MALRGYPPYRHKENSIKCLGFSGEDKDTVKKEAENPVLFARLMVFDYISENGIGGVVDVYARFAILNNVPEAVAKEAIGNVFLFVAYDMKTGRIPRYSEIVECLEDNFGEELFIKIGFVFGLQTAGKVAQMPSSN